MSVPHLLSSFTVKIVSAVTSLGLLRFTALSESSYISSLSRWQRDDECSHDDHHSNAKTKGVVPFKPRNANKGTNSYQLRQFAEATLGSGSLRKAVKLPEGEDLNEWLAVNGWATIGHS